MNRGKTISVALQAAHGRTETSRLAGSIKAPWESWWMISTGQELLRNLQLVWRRAESESANWQDRHTTGVW